MSLSAGEQLDGWTDASPTGMVELRMTARRPPLGPQRTRVPAASAARRRKSRAAEFSYQHLH